MKFRKRPVVIEAVQFTGDNDAEIIQFCPIAQGSHLDHQRTGEAKPYWYFIIPTLEGYHRADPGDWIIKGVKGEFYPCKPDIFELTYEPADLSGEYAELIAWAFYNGWEWYLHLGDKSEYSWISPDYLPGFNVNDAPRIRWNKGDPLPPLPPEVRAAIEQRRGGE